jgi:hypothetical protein
LAIWLLKAFQLPESMLAMIWCLVVLKEIRIIEDNAPTWLSDMRPDLRAEIAAYEKGDRVTKEKINGRWTDTTAKDLDHVRKTLAALESEIAHLQPGSGMLEFIKEDLAKRGGE